MLHIVTLPSSGEHAEHSPLIAGKQLTNRQVDTTQHRAFDVTCRFLVVGTLVRIIQE